MIFSYIQYNSINIDICFQCRDHQVLFLEVLVYQVILEIKGDQESKDPGDYVERLEERYV